ncbi:transcriptional regulator [Xinfangfangia sp. D13-10-4-6]|uniref:helix-turn-helix transcriptional regulator n=1 Tax=Pseudogemmobacter hezensis TaxID=2737662 RepID=UPI001551AAB7|nr:transcriptional regulator [Pseudogemmobacter hezensis]NPD15773.1 transcriptional regulator [Pseudogemmobacter hezensis]
MQPNNIQLIPSQRVRVLCGDISLSALERWTRRPELGFPKARMIGQRRFWVQAEILAWLASREVAA